MIEERDSVGAGDADMLRECADGLRTSGLFAHLDEPTLLAVALRASLCRLHRGEMLVHENGAADALYVILEGRVEVFLKRAGVEDHRVDILGRGDCVGDMALLLGQPRSASVRALRDSRCVRLDASDFHDLLARSPMFAQQLARMLGARLQRTTHRRVPDAPVDTIAVIALHGIDREDFCARVASAITAAVGSACTIHAAVDGMAGAGTHRVIRCDGTPASPNPTALRDADIVLVAADASTEVDPAAIDAIRDAFADCVPRPRIELALVRESSAIARGTRGWLRRNTFSAWHHVRLGDTADVARLARRILGRATGIVLGGGGARGFAHIGVLHAFDELGIPVDCIAGTSMGAIVAGQYAAGYSPAEMLEIARTSYLRRSRPSEFALPYVAIHNGSGTNRRLQAMFGARRIENLSTPYFCVSSDLGTAQPVIHEHGALWLAARCSCSVPGLLPPVRHRGRFLVDGGLLDNLPVDAMRARCLGRVVASDVSVAADFADAALRPHDWRRRRRFPALLAPPRMPGIGAILNRTVSLASVRDAREAGTPADLYLQPDVADIGLSDFARLDEIVERGAAYARARLLAEAF